MSTVISSRLTELRKERKLSQKEASSALGVSQALLSHYEKGIRECGLDFLCRASVFYDVSSDYLLGLSDTKFVSDALFTADELPQDKELRTSTIFRATVFLSEQMNRTGKNYSERIRAIYILTLYQIYASAATHGIIPASSIKADKRVPFLSSGLVTYLISEIYNSQPETKAKRTEKLPVCVETVLTEAVRIAEKQISKAIPNTKKN